MESFWRQGKEQALETWPMVSKSYQRRYRRRGDSKPVGCFWQLFAKHQLKAYKTNTRLCKIRHQSVPSLRKMQFWTNQSFPLTLWKLFIT